MFATWRKRKGDCLSVLFVLDELEETEDRASKRGKTREWIRRRQENGYFTNVVRELAAEDTPAYHQMIRMKFEDFTVILREIEADITPRQVPKGGHKVISAAERLILTFSNYTDTSKRCLW